MGKVGGNVRVRAGVMRRDDPSVYRVRPNVVTDGGDDHRHDQQRSSSDDDAALREDRVADGPDEQPAERRERDEYEREPDDRRRTLAGDDRGGIANDGSDETHDTERACPPVRLPRSAPSAT